MPPAPLGITASHDHFSASGGTVTTEGSYTVHTFTASGQFTISAKGCREIEWTVIGGGGAGGIPFLEIKGDPYTNGFAGGGGGGGYVSGTATLAPHYNGTIVVTAIPVTVGAGGASQANGSSSYFYRDGSTVNTSEPLIGTEKTGAAGGGRGDTYPSPGASSPPNPGWGVNIGYSGSGGGGGARYKQFETHGTSTGKTGFSPNGNSGADGTAGSFGTGGVGGGGGGAGGAASGQTGGSALNGYSKGGSAPTSSPVSGAANTGNGGDAKYLVGDPNLNGGSGVVIIKYRSV